MGLQLIIVVETNKQCKSDWIYIKSTIEHFYKIDQAHTKLSPVYMDSKAKYASKKKEIDKQINHYKATSKTNESHVIYCFDCDDYDKKPEDSKFLETVKKYCKNNGYDFVWFCKDIERVYLDKKVQDKDKKRESEMFSKKKMIESINAEKLLKDNYQLNTSNILRVFDKFLERKNLL